MCFICYLLPVSSLILIFHILTAHFDIEKIKDQ